MWSSLSLKWVKYECRHQTIYVILKYCLSGLPMLFQLKLTNKQWQRFENNLSKYRYKYIDILVYIYIERDIYTSISIFTCIYTISTYM